MNADTISKLASMIVNNSLEYSTWYISCGLWVYHDSEGWSYYMTFASRHAKDRYGQFKRYIGYYGNIHSIVAVKLIFSQQWAVGMIDAPDPSMLLWEDEEHSRYLEYKADDML